MDYVALINELTTDPLTRGYSGMTDAQAATDLNTVYRPANNVLGEMLKYLITRKHRTNQGGDDTFSPIIGRVEHVARSDGGGDPFGRSSGGYTGLDVQHIHACSSFLELFRSQHLLDLDFADSNLPYGFVEASGAWSTTHSADLQALSQNQITRAQELELGTYPVTESHIASARA